VNARNQALFANGGEGVAGFPDAKDQNQMQSKSLTHAALNGTCLGVRHQIFGAETQVLGRVKSN
jgi:hypothetical protein